MEAYINVQLPFKVIPITSAITSPSVILSGIFNCFTMCLIYHFVMYFFLVWDPEFLKIFGMWLNADKLKTHTHSHGYGFLFIAKINTALQED